MGFMQALRAPVLNDVSTDLDDPPSFVVARKAPLPEAWKPLIRKAYPDLQPLRVRPAAAPGDAASPISPPGAETAVVDAVTTVARSMPRCEVVAVEPGPLVEAVATTAVMRFKDDVVVRVRPEGGGGGEGAQAGVLRIDVRSRSRLGKGDLGANAARIRVFLAQLKEELGSRGFTAL